MSSAPAPSAVDVDGPADPELVRIRDLIYEAAGIFHPDGKLRLLGDRCARRMKVKKLAGLSQYWEALTSGPERQSELTALLKDITIGETCFFRNQAQLDAVRQVVLPKMIEGKKKSAIRRIRIWTAGCSTGEEAYTLRMLILQEMQEELKDWVVEILATDLNEDSLEHARQALYGSYSTRNVTAYYREKYFSAAGERWQLLPAVRRGVTFSALNLCDDAGMALMKNIDMIFCCNVLIYFDVASKRRVLERFSNSLLPHGYLFLGQSESLYGVSDQFQLVHLPGATAYVKARQTAGESRNG